MANFYSPRCDSGWKRVIKPAQNVGLSLVWVGVAESSLSSGVFSGNRNGGISHPGLLHRSEVVAERSTPEQKVKNHRVYAHGTATMCTTDQQC